MHRNSVFLCASQLLCAALVIGSASFGACAAERALSKQYNTCMNQFGSSTMRMIDCIIAENKRQDARLNTAYKALMADLPPARKTQLLEAQRAWIKFRDANCSFYFDPDGGTSAHVIANDCVMTTTTSRAVELEQLNSRNK